MGMSRVEHPHLFSLQVILQVILPGIKSPDI